MTPGAAIGWGFRARHRLGFIAVVAILLAIGTIKLIILGTGRFLTLDDVAAFALVVMVPMSSMFTYFLAVFTFGTSGDLAARQSMYPTRMFTLPMTTAALAAWPMLYGAIAMVGLWAFMRLLAVWPTGFDTPVVWPALLAASLLAWAQALTWMPYPLRGLRVVVTLLWLTVIEAIVMVGLEFKVPESVMVAFLAPHVSLAYLVARYAVGRARRGDIPDWQATFARLGRLARLAARKRANFRSPERAQAWFEWERNGLTLPSWVAMLLPFELALLWLAGDSAALVFAILIGAFITPPVMAGFVAASVRKSNPDARDSLGVSPFIATRPLSDAQLIAAKLKATVWSTIAAWLLVLIAVPVALEWSETWPVVADRMRSFSGAVGTPRTVVVLLLFLAGLVASTWKQLVQTLWVGLSGREWVVNASVVMALLVFGAIGPALVWLAEHRYAIARLWDALPQIMAVLVAVKLIAAAWLTVRLDRGRVLGAGTLVTGAVLWLAAVLALYGLLVWMIDAPIFPNYLLGLIAILAIPLVRVSAAPLALAWNRHR